MFYRNWLPEIGIVIGVIISILLALNFAELTSRKDIASSNKVEQTSAIQQTTDQPANEQQDESLYWNPDITQWIIASTGVLALIISAWAVWLIKRTLSATVGTLDQTRTATEISKKQLIASQRPWLKVELTPGDGIINSEYGNSHISVQLVVTNVGNYPAKNISMSIGVYFAEVPQMIRQRKPIIDLTDKEQCNSVFPQDRFRQLIILFPGEYSGVIQTSFIGHDEVGIKGRLKEAHVFAYGCVEYTFDTSADIHRTATLREFLWKRGGTKPNQNAMLEEPSIPPEDLELRRSPHCDDFAS